MRFFSECKKLAQIPASTSNFDFLILNIIKYNLGCLPGYTLILLEYNYNFQREKQ